MRTVADLEAGLRILLDDPKALNLYSVNHARRNPYFNMVEREKDGYYHLSKKPQKPVLSRQTAPVVYELNASFYFFRREFFRQSWTSAYSDRALVYLMPHPCFDLDEPVDFDFLEFLIQERRLGFDL
jgi:CMP-N-acetylneuraminic acid synthetase